MHKTSWSDTDLEKLTNRENHRIIFNGIEYVWEHHLKNKRELHSIFLYKDYKILYSNLQFWLHNWKKELDKRREKDCDLLENLKQTDKAVKIANGSYTTKKKVQLICELMPNESVQYIADILQITRQAVYKHLR